MTRTRDGEDGSVSGRRVVMALCAEAHPDELARAVTAIPSPPPWREIRAPETGLVMVRGRIGGDGAAFNLGEATITRAAVSLESGEIGFGHVLGRSRAKARDAALLDALWQAPDWRDAVTAALAPVRDRVEAEAAVGRARTAATRVDFFTLVRGDA